MDRGRCLILATVTSIKDSTVVYPCCSECNSRLLQDTKDRSFWCSTCHLTFDQLNVSYRYRLSVVIAENNVLANVTAFGRTLQPFFGTSATSFNRFNHRFSDKCMDVGCYSSDILSQALEISFVGKHFWFGLQKGQGPRGNADILSPPHLPDLLGNTNLGLVVGKLSSGMVASQMIPVEGDAPTVIDHMNYLLEKKNQAMSVCNSSATCFDRSRSFRLSNCFTFGGVTPLTRAHDKSEQSCVLSCERDQVNMNWSNHESYISSSTSKRQNDSVGRTLLNSFIQELPGPLCDHDPNCTLPPESNQEPIILMSPNQVDIPEQNIEILGNATVEALSQTQSMVLDDSSFLLECDRMENVTSHVSNLMQSNLLKADISDKSSNMNCYSIVEDLIHQETEHLKASSFRNNSNMSSSKICSQNERSEAQTFKCISTVHILNGTPSNSLCSVGTHHKKPQDNLLCKLVSLNGQTNNEGILVSVKELDRLKCQPPYPGETGQLAVICEQLWDDWSGCGGFDHLELDLQETKCLTKVHEKNADEISNSNCLPQSTAGAVTSNNEDEESQCAQQWDNLPESEDLDAFLCGQDVDGEKHPCDSRNTKGGPDEVNRTCMDGLELNALAEEIQDSKCIFAEIVMYKDQSKTVRRSGEISCNSADDGSQCNEHERNAEDLETVMCHHRTHLKDKPRSVVTNNTDPAHTELSPVSFKDPQSSLGTIGNAAKLPTEACVGGSVSKQNWEDLPESEDLEAFLCDYEQDTTNYVKLKSLNKLDNPYIAYSSPNVKYGMKATAIPNCPSFHHVGSEEENISKVCIGNSDHSTAKSATVECDAENTLAGSFPSVKSMLPFKCVDVSECEDEHSMDLFNSSSRDESCAKITSLMSQLEACSFVSENSMHNPIAESQTTPGQKFSPKENCKDSDCRTSCRKGVTFSKRLSAISNVQLMDIRMRIAPNPTIRDYVTSKSCLKRQSRVFVFDKIKESIIELDNKNWEGKVGTPSCPRINICNLKVDNDLANSEDLFTPSPILQRDTYPNLSHSVQDSHGEKYSESTPLLFSQCATSDRKHVKPFFLTPKLSFTSGVCDHSVDLFASPDLFSQSGTGSCNPTHTASWNLSRTNVSNQSGTISCDQSDWVPPSNMKGLCKTVERTSLPVQLNPPRKNCGTSRSEPDVLGEIRHSYNVSTNLHLSLNITSCSADLFSPELILATPQPQQSKEFLRKNLFF